MDMEWRVDGGRGGGGAGGGMRENPYLKTHREQCESPGIPVRLAWGIQGVQCEGRTKVADRFLFSVSFPVSVSLFCGSVRPSGSTTI